MERRPFLLHGGASVLALLAGVPSSTAETTADGPAEVVDEYYRRASDAEDAAAFAEEVPALAHSASPLPDVATDVPSAFAGALQRDLVSSAVVERDLDAVQIRDISEFLAASVSDRELDALTDENAVVAATLETDEVAGGTVTINWLVAPEDDAWRIVWFWEGTDPRAAVGAFVREVSSVAGSSVLDEPVETLSHRRSPLMNVAEYTPWVFDGLQRQTIVRAEVVAEDIDKRDIASEFTQFASWTTEDGIEAIAEENAVVSVSLQDDRLGIEQFEQQWLVAPDAGEWRVVWF